MNRSKYSLASSGSTQVASAGRRYATDGSESAQLRDQIVECFSRPDALTTHCLLEQLAQANIDVRHLVLARPWIKDITLGQLDRL